MARTSLEAAVPAVEYERARARADVLWVDLRSPGEFAVDHVPGAVNVPLFDDLERALIGTLYARDSPQAAFEEGRRRTVARIGDLVQEMARLAGWDVPGVDLRSRVEAMTAGGIERLSAALRPDTGAPLPERPVVLSCWRGGLRSRSVVALLRGLGLDRAVCLAGGYKAYRAAVRARLAAWEAPPTVVLRGLTGVGKTLVLRALEEARPGWTLDLEGLAGHRSSILGMVGLEPVSQKAFDSRLAERLERGFPGPCVVEGESRKVGDVILPPRVWAALEGGANVRLVAPVERRVEVLVEDYLAEEANRAHLRRQLPFLEARLGGAKWEGVLVGLLDDRRDGELVEILLERYYDPLYLRSERTRDHPLEVDASDPTAAAAEIAAWIEAGGPRSPSAGPSAPVGG